MGSDSCYISHYIAYNRLTFADLTGNTDVAAFIAPYIVKAPVG